MAMGSGGSAEVIDQVEGLDQGCPLSVAFFANGIAEGLQSLKEWLLGCDARGRMWAYLDDVYGCAPKDRLLESLQRASSIFAEIGLDLNELKTKLWCPNGVTQGIPERLLSLVVGELPVLGSTIPFVRQRDEEASVEVIVAAVHATGACHRLADQLVRHLFGGRTRSEKRHTIYSNRSTLCQ